MKISNLESLAKKVSKSFGLCYKRLEEYPNTHKDFGECNHIGVIKIRLYRRGTKIPLATKTVLDSLAHELAHLKVWDHGKAHNKLTKEILEELLFIYEETNTRR